MKIIKVVGYMVFLGTSFFISESSEAQEVSNSRQNSTIGIEVVQSPISLTNVQPPTFTTYPLQEGGQTLQATGDLIIDIEDTRTENASSWALQYGISTFENTTDSSELNGSVVIKIGSGDLSMDETSMSSSSYKSQSVELAQGNQGILLQVDSSREASYQYRVPKENISIRVPTEATVGQYQAIQTVNLTSLPSVN